MPDKITHDRKRSVSMEQELASAKAFAAKSGSQSTGVSTLTKIADYAKSFKYQFIDKHFAKKK